MIKARINNKAYSLVEMIIVLGIIAVVSVMSLASVTMIHSAKAKDAAVVFDSQVSELIAKAKGQNVDSSKLYAIRLYKSGSSYYVQTGIANKSGGSYVFTADPDNLNGGTGTSLSKFVKISYYPEKKDDGTYGGYSTDWDSAYEVDDTGVLIVFTKSGNCVNGSGTYCFFKRNNSNVARDIVRMNGSHESR